MLVAEEHRDYFTNNVVYDFNTQNLVIHGNRRSMIENWRTKGSWQTPPVIIPWSDRSLQLVKGHTRLGSLMNLLRVPRQDFRLSSEHLVDLMLCPVDRSKETKVFRADSV